MEELLKRGRFTVVRELTNVDAVVEGEILSWNVAPVNFSVGHRDDAGHALRDLAHRERRVPQDRPEGADLVERRVLPARRVRHGRERPELLRPRGCSRSSGSPRPSPAASWPPCWRRSSPDGARLRAPARSRRSSGRTPTSPRRPSSGSWRPRSATTAQDALQVLYGDETKWEDVLAAARTGSLFVSRRAVVVRRAELLKYANAPTEDEAPEPRAGRERPRSRKTPSRLRRRPARASPSS